MMLIHAVGRAAVSQPRCVIVKYIGREDTEDIDSDDPDIFERKKKFERVLKKFNKHRDEKMIALKGNDLRYNVYLKKM